MIGDKMKYERIYLEEKEKIRDLSEFASKIVKEHFDSIIGAAQNDYMISKFQTPESIEEQIKHGYEYYEVFVDCIDNEDGKRIGFVSILEREEELYLSKFYVEKSFRGKGYSRKMFEFVCKKAKEKGYHRVSLNVNKNNDAIYAYEKFGMIRAREEKNDIGNGFFMDDYVYEYTFD